MTRSFLAPFTAFVCTALVVACNYNVEQRHFATRNAARSAGEEGWLPAFLPPSAYDIHVWQNGDSGSERGAARFEAADIVVLRGNLGSWKAAPTAPPAVDFEWWPSECRTPGAAFETYVVAPPLSKAVAIKPD